MNLLFAAWVWTMAVLLPGLAWFCFRHGLAPEETSVRVWSAGRVPERLVDSVADRPAPERAEDRMLLVKSTAPVEPASLPASRERLEAARERAASLRRAFREVADMAGTRGRGRRQP